MRLSNQSWDGGYQNSGIAEAALYVYRNKCGRQEPPEFKRPPLLKEESRY
ncbi:hypothetical protein [Xanthomonas sp. 3075]|nr:hypothetical protein [Xanthomonas sp. 3075]MBB4131814.1 hypothetical protein [Xanthomonas sp. 3075]